jgi:AcrR family transcriptional regulator
MNENDLRVKRTRNLLRQALIDLVCDQGYENVTVRDITQKAQVGYKTFYRHYEGKEAFLQALVEEMVTEAQQLLLPPSDQRALKHNTATILSYVETHAALVLTILRSPAANQLIRAAEAIAFVDGTQTFQNTHVPHELVAHHFASSMITFLRWWLESGLSTPKEQMAEYVDYLLIGPLQQALAE